MRKEVIGDATLYLGDCMEVMTTLGKVDAVVTDPPYGTTQCTWDSVLCLKDMWNCLNNNCRQDTPVILFAQTPFDKVLGSSNIEMLKYEWIWEKTAATGHLNAKKMPMKAHENILVFYESLPTYNPKKTTGHKPTNSYTKRKGDGDCYGKTAVVSGGGETERFPRSIIKFSSDKQKESLHPTQKPVSLMMYLVETYTNTADTVLDFTMGSGTTGVACLQMRRKFIGIEKDPEYFEIACERIKRENDQLKLF
jgi:site-specific DNA-methyltransferase (adenine-specific)